MLVWPRPKDGDRLQRFSDKIKQQKIDVPCPDCGTTIKASLQDALDGKTVNCPGCRSDVRLQGDDTITKSLDAVDKSIQGIEKELKKIGKLR
jgi:endogenous inhibitor of DNA gyrase (YacG/DUF329 family)